MDDFIYKVRTYLHQNPELGYNTHNTAKFINNTLIELGYKPILTMNDTAVIVYLDLGKDKTIALRSDMDALEIKEETGADFKSLNNYMHACGHDIHMSILLYTAKLIKENIDKINYNVILFFQPAEEGPLPGGAYYLKEHEILKKADYFYAYHVSPSLEVGKIGIKRGEACAAPDLWELELTGVGCHASRPENGKNPILAGSEIALELEKFFQSYKKEEKVVISTTYFNSGVAMNIIKDKAYLKGTARSFNDKARKYLHQQMDKIISNICDKYGISYKFDFHYAYPPLYNEPALVDHMFDIAKDVVGMENTIELEESELVGEDFAYYREIAPICLAWIGSKDKNAAYYDLHNSHFLPSFSTIEIGSKIFINLLTK